MTSFFLAFMSLRNGVYLVDLCLDVGVIRDGCRQRCFDGFATDNHLDRFGEVIAFPLVVVKDHKGWRHGDAQFSGPR